MGSSELGPTAQERGPLGAYLWGARKALGWSLREVEEKGGVSNAYISQIENGTMLKPSPSILLKLATAYKAPYQHLMELAGHLAAPSKDKASKRQGALPTSTLPDVELTAEEEKEVREFIAFIRMRNRKTR